MIERCETLDERIDRLDYLLRRGVATWEDRADLARLKREQAERDYRESVEFRKRMERVK